MSKLTTPNPVFKPFSYPWAFEAWQDHERMHWLPEEVPLADDVKDWAMNITDSERNLLTQIFRFFTQQDILVGGAYVDQYLKIFQPTEIRMMLMGFAARECIHVAAYAHLLDTIGMPEVEYSAFLEYAQMKEKFEYAQQFNVDSPQDVAKTLAVFSAFMEGLQLFASFAMLMNFPRFNKMKGMGQIVAWSVRDESCFSEDTEILTNNGWKLFKDLDKENDLVAQYDKGVISFVKPLHYTDKEYKGKMVYFSSEKSPVNQLLTPDHRVLFYDEYHEDLNVLEAEEFNPHSRKYFLTAGHVDGEKTLAPWEKVFIALQADGTIPKGEYRNGNLCGYRRVNFNLTKQRKKDRLETICTEAGFNFSRKDLDDGSSIFYVDIPVEYPVSKNFSDWVADYTEVSSVWAKGFIEELVHWDGHRIEDSDDRYYYSSVVKENVVVAQTIAALAGYKTNVSKQVDNRKDNYKDVHRLYIDKSKRGIRTGCVRKDYVDYSGRVYCVTVPSGFIMVKRGNDIVISGNCHVENMIKLFRAYVEENIEIWNDDLKKQLYDIAREMVHHEDAFIDLAFEMGGVEGMTADDIKQYIRFIADRRLIQLGLKPNFGVKENPIPWMDEMLNAPEFANFFEQRVTEYSRAATTGSWEEAFSIHDDKAKEFIIYGQVGCPQCVHAKNLMHKLGFKYKYVDLTGKAEEKASLYQQTGAKSMPMIFEVLPNGSDRFFGSFFDLQKLEE